MLRKKAVFNVNLLIWERAGPSFGPFFVCSNSTYFVKLILAELADSVEARAYADGVIIGLQENNCALAAVIAELQRKVHDAEQAGRRAKDLRKGNKTLRGQLESATEECRRRTFMHCGEENKQSFQSAPS